MIVGLLAREMKVEKGGMSIGHLIVVTNLGANAVQGERLNICEIMIGDFGADSFEVEGQAQMFDAVCISKNMFFWGYSEMYVQVGYIALLKQGAQSRP